MHAQEQFTPDTASKNSITLAHFMIYFANKITKSSAIFSLFSFGAHANSLVHDHEPSNFSVEDDLDGTNHNQPSAHVIVLQAFGGLITKKCAHWKNSHTDTVERKF